MSADTLAVKGRKKTTGLSSNRGKDNIISKGSAIAVADGQCMVIVEQGKIVDLCAEPGEFVYDSSTEPTIFAGNPKLVNISPKYRRQFINRKRRQDRHRLDSIFAALEQKNPEYAALACC